MSRKKATVFLDPIQAVIANTQNQVWTAEHFISQGINIEYWNGWKDASESILDGFRATGISVSEVVNQMSNEYDRH